MRDDRDRLPAAIGQGRPVIKGRDLAIEIESQPRQTIISGPYAAALAYAGLDMPAVGSGDVAQGESYAVRLRRDRILVVGGPLLENGWVPSAEVAISDMSQGYAVLTLNGAGALPMLQTGTEYEFTSSSGSASRLWNGYPCLMYRFAVPTQFRLHVPTAYLDAIWDMLVRQAALLQPLDRVEVT